MKDDKIKIIGYIIIFLIFFLHFKNITIAGQKELRELLEDDYRYYQRVVVPSGKKGQVYFLKKLIKKYEEKGLDEMYLIPIKEELKSHQYKEEYIEPTTPVQINDEKYLKIKRQFEAPKVNLKRNEAIIKVGYDMSGKHKIDGKYTIDYYSFEDSSEEDVKDNVSLTGEYIIYLNDYFGLGGGITYQIPREQKEYDGKFNFIPIYGLMKLRTVPYDIYQPSFYLTGQLGYNFFDGDSDYRGDGSLDDGLYYGMGGGLTFNNGLLFELLYSVNRGSYNLSGTAYDWWYGYWYSYKVDLDIEYSLIRLSVGYVF